MQVACYQEMGIVSILLHVWRLIGTHHPIDNECIMRTLRLRRDAHCLLDQYIRPLELYGRHFTATCLSETHKLQSK